MKRSKSSRRWLSEHFQDPFVKQAKQDGYRGRAAYKLIQLQEKYAFIKKGMIVVDLGAAPGSWSQCAVDWVGERGQVVALDILPMNAIDGVVTIQGDFREEICLQQLIETIQAEKVDVVLSDMAPNSSGVLATDQPRELQLAKLALEFAENFLADSGSFLVKIFMGEGFDQYLQNVKRLFRQVKVCKPEASRARSREIYVYAAGRR